MGPIKTVVCPTDFSEPSRAGLMAAIELAGRYHARIHVVYAIAPLPLIGNAFVYSSSRENMPYTIEDLEVEARSSLQNLIDTTIPADIASTGSILHGRPAEEITRYAEEQRADMITIATHGQSGWQRFLFGSVAERVVRMAHCPVLIVKQPHE